MAAHELQHLCDKHGRTRRRIRVRKRSVPIGVRCIRPVERDAVRAWKDERSTHEAVADDQRAEVCVGNAA